MYIASDSRISWSGAAGTGVDFIPKVMACATQPEIFGYAGYVLLPYVAISQACTAIDHGMRGTQAEQSSDAKREWLWKRIWTLASGHPRGAQYAFTVLYGVRTGSKAYIARKGKEPPVHTIEEPNAVFDLYICQWDGISNALTTRKYPVSQTTSAVLKLSGTGEESIKAASEVWENSSSQRTSRAMFAALCQSLKTGSDSQSGGAPQLVGMYRKGNAKVFGVVTSEGAFFQGMKVESDDPPSAAVEWRDLLLRRVDAYGKLLAGAKSRDADVALFPDAGLQ